MPNTIKRPTWKPLYPEQNLCFWTGFLTSYFFIVHVCMFAATVNLIRTGQPFDFNRVLTCLILLPFGLPIGILSVGIGFLLNKLRTTSRDRWLWVSFVICQFANLGIWCGLFMLDCLTVTGHWSILLSSTPPMWLAITASAAIATWIGIITMVSLWKCITSKLRKSHP